MNVTQALALLATTLQLPDATTTKGYILAIAQAAGLDTTSFELGDPSERYLEIAAQALGAWGAVPSAAVQAVFFALSTDPGDVNDLGAPDPSTDQTPRPGMLSAYGQGFWGTTRGGRGYATSLVTVKNNGAVVVGPFQAGQLVLEASGLVRADGGTPTYVTTADPSIYTGIGGTLTLAAGASVVLPVRAVQIGSYGSAAQGAIDTVVTQSFGPLVITASTTAAGQDREARLAYIARCLLAADSNAPGGSVNAYLRAMNTAKDGTVLQRFDGSGQVNITQAYVSPSSATGRVTMYVGGIAGAVDDIDVTSATANILGLLVADAVSGAYHNPDPIGVLPDTVTIGPTTSDPNLPAGTPGCASCINTTIALTYAVKIKSSRVSGGATPGTYTTGGSPPPPVAALFNAILAAYGSYLFSTGIGGLDQVTGAGVVYTADLPPTIRGAVAGLYDPVVTAPSGSTTAITLGHIAAPGVVMGTLVVVAG